MISLKHWEQDVDLRNIGRSKAFWWAAKCHLADNQGILFTNERVNRCRMIVMLDGMPWMLTPPVADQEHTLTWIFDMAMSWMSGLRGARAREVIAA